MSFGGHVQNGVVVFDGPVTVPDGTAVRVEVIAPVGKRSHGEDWECFEELAPVQPLDAASKDALRALLTPEQYAALVEIQGRGGPDVDAIRRFRSASMT